MEREAHKTEMTRSAVSSLLQLFRTIISDWWPQSFQTCNFFQACLSSASTISRRVIWTTTEKVLFKNRCISAYDVSKEVSPIGNFFTGQIPAMLHT